MSQTVKGVIDRGKGLPVELVDINVPKPGPGEARVRVQASYFLLLVARPFF